MIPNKKKGTIIYFLNKIALTLKMNSGLLDEWVYGLKLNDERYRLITDTSIRNEIMRCKEKNLFSECRGCGDDRVALVHTERTSEVAGSNTPRSLHNKWDNNQPGGEARLHALYHKWKCLWKKYNA